MPTDSFADWTVHPLGKVADITLGGTPSTDVPAFWGGTIPWMSSGEVNKKRIYEADGRITEAGLAASNATLVEPPSVAIGLAGQGKTRGTAALVNIRVCTNQSIALIKGRSDLLDTAFLFHNLDARYEELRTRSAGGGRAGLSQEILAEVPIALPDVPEQSRIAAVLDTVDEAIAKTEAMIAKLRLVRCGLLHDLLAIGLDKHGQLRDPIAHPGQFQDSPLGRIPRDWNICGVLDVAPSDRQAILTGPFGAQLSQRDFVAQGVPVLRIGNVQSGYIDWSDTQFVTEAKAIELKRFSVIPGDLLFARQGATTGRNALADARASGAIINYHIIRVATDRKRCEPIFLHALFNADSALRQINRDKGRGTREGINTEQIASLRFAIPPIDEQRLAVAALASHDDQLQSELASLIKLQQLKSGLSNDLLTGRVRVPEKNSE